MQLLLLVLTYLTVTLLDNEAFDRVAHSVLLKAVSAVGFGPDLQKWFKILYGPDTPTHATRQVRVNGVLSSSFPVLSGVPQGGVLSPLAFMIIAEALLRMIKTDPSLEGMSVPGACEEFRFSGYADDSVLILKGISSIGPALDVVNSFCRGTGMRINVAKTEGLLLGALRSLDPPPQVYSGRPRATTSSRSARPSATTTASASSGSAGTARFASGSPGGAARYTATLK